MMNVIVIVLALGLIGCLTYIYWLHHTHIIKYEVKTTRKQENRKSHPVDDDSVMSRGDGDSLLLQNDDAVTNISMWAQNIDLSMD